jgi:hypothetical protein
MKALRTEQQRAEINKKRREKYAANKKRIREEHRAWYKKNKDKYKKYRERLSPEQRKINGILWASRARILFPWRISLYAARTRCSNPNHVGYCRYGGRGIRCLLTEADVKHLWIRDNAGGLKKPSLDRIDNKKDYTLENCRFIELSDNCRKGNREKSQRVAREIAGL